VCAAFKNEYLSMQWFDTKILVSKLQLLPKMGLYFLKNTHP
jgi:hypothetical protein